MVANGKAATVQTEKDEEPSFYEIEANLEKLCEFLRSSDGPAVREAIEMDKRVYYLKGMLESSFHFLRIIYLKKCGR